MKCPVCDAVNLVMSERQGVEIDYCPQCRGVWLDRGELDKIIERSASHAEPQRPQGHGEGGGGGRERGHSHGHGHDHHNREHGYKKKKGSLLGELFDF